MDEKQRIAERIRDCVNFSGKRPVDIAAEMGIHNSVLYAYMRGKTSPHAALIKKLCLALNCDYSDIFGDIKN